MRKFVSLIVAAACLFSSVSLAFSGTTTELSPVSLSDFMVDYSLIWQAGEWTAFDFDESSLDFVNGFAKLNYTILMFGSDTNILGGMTFVNKLVPADILYVIEAYSKDYEFGRTYKTDGTDMLLLDTIEFSADLLESAQNDPQAILEFYGRKYRVVAVDGNAVVIFGDSDAALVLMETLVGSLDK